MILWEYFLIAAQLTLTVIFIFKFKLIQKEKNQLQIKYDYATRQLKLEEDYFREMKRCREEIRHLWHDMGNHMQCMYGLLKNNKKDKVEIYLNNLIDGMQSLKLPVECGNHIIDAVLYEKYNLAARRCINIRLDADIPEKLAFDDLDLCILVGNSLDNAIEACSKVENPEDKKIDVFIREKESYLYILVINTFRDEPVKSGKWFRTSKKDEGYHGIGYENMSRVVRKYKGSIKTSFENNIFTFEAKMFLK